VRAEASRSNAIGVVSRHARVAISPAIEKLFFII